MTLADYWGIFTCALLIPVVVGVPFFLKKGRLPLTVTVVILSLCPFFPEGLSLAQHIFSLTDALSVILLVGLFQKLSDKEFVVWNLFEIVFLLLFGLILYASSLGFLPDFLYGGGFRPILALGAALVFMGVASDWKKRLYVVGAFVFFLLGLYANFYDALFDPILLILAIFTGLTKVTSRFKMRSEC
ncbi:MAG: hypothetical protein ACI4UF_00865 [Thermoguttaceae bacterium]